MQKTCLAVFALICCTLPVFAQTEPAQASAPVSTPDSTQAPTRWIGVGAATRFNGSGLTLSYGQRDLFAPGTDAHFSASYFNASPYSPGFAAELSADALAYTRDPAAEGLALVAYGGLGPRFLVQSNVYYYAYSFDDTYTSYQLNIGGVGGLEVRLRNFGVLLELDISLPAFGLLGPYFRVFPTEAFPIPKLTLGANYYF